MLLGGFIVINNRIVEVEKLLPLTTQAQENKQDKETTATSVDASTNVAAPAADASTTPQHEASGDVQPF